MELPFCSTPGCEVPTLLLPRSLRSSIRGAKPSAIDNQEWFAQHGLVQTQIDMDRVIDNRFGDAALARLGRYSAP